ncbi:MAG: hypothetical protein GY841_20110 [FCB group bacterium]|nr:hypothetical protein [FCB group bacterium]
MSDEILRYLAWGLQLVDFDTKAVAPLFATDIASTDLDSPDSPQLEYQGGSGRSSIRIVPGPYSISGSAEWAMDVSMMHAILYLLMGDKTTVDNTTPVTDEDISFGVGETAKAFSLVNTQIIRGSFLLYDDGTTDLIAHDDGFGRILEDAASGFSGWIDYSTGDLYLAGGTAETDYDADYSHGTYEHTLVATSQNILPYFTAMVGKDIDQQDFVGCLFNQLTMSVEAEFIKMQAEIKGKNDSLAAGGLIDQDELPIPTGAHGEAQRAFHDMALWLGDSGGALSDTSAKCNSLSMTFNNGADVEGQIALNDRFPTRGRVGKLEVSGAMSLEFDSFDLKKDFWGDAAGASNNNPTEKAIRIIIDSGDWGDIQLDMTRVNLGKVGIAGSGVEEMRQEITYKALLDLDLGTPITAIVNNLHDFST